MKKIMRIEDYVKENREVINDLRIASALLEKRRPIIAESLMDLAERLDDLAESEDERVRKWIANYIHRGVFDEEEHPKALKAIEYLEKQKESLRDFIDDFPYSDQKEQKPTESISHLTVKGEGVYKICPRCKERMIRDDSKVYTSMPPQYGYECPKCGAMEFDTVIYDNPEIEEPKQECNDNERIRKDIIALIKFGLNDGSAVSPGSYTTKEEALAYLEKQKEAGKAIEAVDRIDKYIDEHLANAHDMKDSNPDKKYYRGWDDALGKMAGILQDVYSDEKQKEQKFTHHEIDESLRDAVTHQMEDDGDVDDFIRKGIDDIVLKYAELGARWQKEQKPAEWSEEDEDMYARVVRRYTDYEGVIMRTKEESVAAKMLDAMAQEEIWLKSLRNRVGKEFLQPHWKPSEEQMKALLKVVDKARELHYSSNSGYDEYDVLRSLYKQLKELM